MKKISQSGAAPGCSRPLLSPPPPSPQTFARVFASPVLRLESVQCPKLSTPRRPSAAAARTLQRVGGSPVNCALRRTVVSPPPPSLSHYAFSLLHSSLTFLRYWGLFADSPSPTLLIPLTIFFPVTFQELCPFGHGAVPGPDGSRKGKAFFWVLGTPSFCLSSAWILKLWSPQVALESTQ